MTNKDNPLARIPRPDDNPFLDNTIDGEIKYEFGNDPTYYLEHAFRHLEVLCGEYNHDEITNQQFHSYRGQLKAQLQHKIAQEANKARLDELRIMWDWPKDKGLAYFEQRIQKREAELIRLTADKEAK